MCDGRSDQLLLKSIVVNRNVIEMKGGMNSVVYYAVRSECRRRGGGRVWCDNSDTLTDAELAAERNP